MNAVTILEHRSSDKSATPKVYRYAESGLDNIWLVGGFSLESVDGEECLFIEDREALHEAIARDIVRRGDRMNGRELRFIRLELNLTQEHLAALLDSEAQTVARWEKGKSRVPGPADRLIRVLYTRKSNCDEDVVEMLETLSELDRLTVGKQRFEHTGSGWREAA